MVFVSFVTIIQQTTYNFPIITDPLTMFPKFNYYKSTRKDTLKRRTGIVAIAAGVALVAGLYFGTATPSTIPSRTTPFIPVLQINQTFTRDNRTYDQAAIPMVANQQYRLDDVTFTYLGNATAGSSECPPADLKSFNELYHGNEIKHFRADLKNGTSVNLDTCWPLPHIPSTSTQSRTGSGVSLPLQMRVESRWFDQDSKTAGIIQDPVYFIPGNTTFYYFAERTIS